MGYPSRHFAQAQLPYFCGEKSSPIFPLPFHISSHCPASGLLYKVKQWADSHKDNLIFPACHLMLTAFSLLPSLTSFQTMTHFTLSGLQHPYPASFYTTGIICLVKVKVQLTREKVALCILMRVALMMTLLLSLF